MSSSSIAGTQTFVAVIDSRLRNTELFPLVHSYVVDFPHVFKNVISVELVYAIYGSNNISGSDTYVNLRIDELNPNLISNNNILTGSFTQLPITHPGINTYSPHTHFKSARLFETPLSKMGKLTISFVSSIGTPFEITEHFLRFEVKCIRGDLPLENVMRGLGPPAISANSTHVVSLKADMEYFDLNPNFKLNDLIQAYKRKCSLFNITNATIQEREFAKNAFKTLARGFKQPV